MRKKCISKIHPLWTFLPKSFNGMKVVVKKWKRFIYFRKKKKREEKKMIETDLSVYLEKVARHHFKTCCFSFVEGFWIFEYLGLLESASNTSMLFLFSGKLLIGSTSLPSAHWLKLRKFAQGVWFEPRAFLLSTQA